MSYLFCCGVPMIGVRRGVITPFMAFQAYPSVTTAARLSMKGTPTLAIQGTSFSPLSQRAFSTSSSSDNDDVVITKTTPRRRRRRHNFDLDQVPSFEAFQQQQNIRALYRSFLRLAYGSSSRHELVQQVRREFRQGVPLDDPWALKRAISDGGKRYKELSAMLSSVPGSSKNAPPASQETQKASKKSSSSAWPWQGGKSPGKPLAFPKR
eukprot:scaffold2992_cov214-Amphora_coffeaeformis.AAC.49